MDILEKIWYDSLCDRIILNMDYRKCEARQKEYMQQIDDALSENKHKLFLEYEEVQNEMMDIVGLNGFRQGVNFCLNLFVNGSAK